MNMYMSSMLFNVWFTICLVISSTFQDPRKIYRQTVGRQSLSASYSAAISAQLLMQWINAIHPINHYPVDRHLTFIQWTVIYPAEHLNSWGYVYDYTCSICVLAAYRIVILISFSSTIALGFNISFSLHTLLYFSQFHPTCSYSGTPACGIQHQRE